MITVTELAAKEVKRIIEEKSGEDYETKHRDFVSGAPWEDTSKDIYLRIGVMGGGCSGFRYSLDLTEAKTDNDEVYPQHGIVVICDPKSHLYLDGTTVDFKDEVMGRGFVFNNPNATSRCGCGDSFSA